ncbi:NF038104 family lipoprotein [Acinetobacter sp. S40]|uniref:NF038104 family lipoprotein n=1 Tax=unclassified Acinetobacter TaxID=196816 RepID=UPI0019093001|nr:MULTISPECIES: NF038104 family lipoprotein [unclassified Acinetobacter]MBJ9986860.1 NF038104 family lipoprotein [Acinetobacter sp. S40]MBK0064865.1 NF038104 family lipoprotein [Acinetobacter sp. S55]MBK0068392.1 NF038104 family lipoprotein [Acinetobacter sp. S54]
MTVIMRCVGVLACVLMLQGCITKIVTVPVKVAYGTTKAVVKGTAAVVEAVIPDGDDDKDQQKKDD